MTLSLCHNLQNVIRTQKCEPFQLNKQASYFSHFPAGGFPSDTSSSTLLGVQALPQFIPWTTTDEFNVVAKTQRMSLMSYPSSLSSPFNIQDPSITYKYGTSGRHTGMKHGSDGCFSTALGRQPTFCNPFILRIISFSHHQAVVYSWEFHASLVGRMSFLMPTPYGLGKRCLHTRNGFSSTKIYICHFDYPA